MDNMELWNGLCKTDPKFTKPFSRAGGFKGTAINATYVIRELTRKFGPCGVGWRFVLDWQGFQDGGPVMTKPNQPMCFSKVHIVLGHLEYRLASDGNEPASPWRSTGPQYGQTTFVGEYSSGVFTDEEAPKKSVTDCLTKCATMLGVSADIYLHEFDDNKYVNQPTTAKVSTTVLKIAETEPPKKPTKAKAAKAAEQLATVPTADLIGVVAESPDAADLLNIFKSYQEAGVMNKEILEAVAARARVVCKDPECPERPALIQAIKEQRGKLNG